MAFYLNKILLGGNITADPEVKVVGSNKVCNFSLAINRIWYSPGEPEETAKKEETVFVRITAWNKLAEQLGNHVKKGANLYVEGRLRQRKWNKDDPNNQYRDQLDVIAEKITFISVKGREITAETHVPEAEEEYAQNNHVPEEEGTEDLWK